MSTPHPEFWLILLPKRTDNGGGTDRRHKQCLVVLAVLEKIYPDIYNADPQATITQTLVDTISATLQKNVSGHIIVQRLRFLTRGLQQGTERYGWPSVTPQIPLLIPRETTRFSKENFLDLALVRQIEESFRKDLECPFPDKLHLRLGKLLLSGILYGGLLRSRWLTPWLRALQSPQLLGEQLTLTMWHHIPRKRDTQKTSANAVPDFELSIPPESDLPAQTDPEFKAETIKRCWFADPITQALLRQWTCNYPDDVGQMSEHCRSPFLTLTNYLKLICSPQLWEEIQRRWASEKKKTEDADRNQKRRKRRHQFATRLLNGAATRIRLFLPTFLEAFASGNIRAVPLPRTTWIRLISGKALDLPLNLQESTVDLVKDRKKLQQTLKSVTLTDQENLLKLLLADINTTGVNETSREVLTKVELFWKNHGEECLQPLCALISWACFLLRHDHRNIQTDTPEKSALAPSSVQRYLGSFGYHLIAAAEKIDLEALEDGDDFAGLYRDVLQRVVSTKEKIFASARLIQFHRFLVCEFDLPPVDGNDFGVPGASAELSVNANLITPHEFDKIYDSFNYQNGSITRLRTMQLLVLIFGFRCALRRGEIRKIRLIDIMDSDRLELLIRTNKYAKLKTSAALRRVPLYLLLEPVEMQLVRDFISLRYHEEQKITNDMLLFADQGLAKTLINDAILFDPVVRVMRSVTGDDSLRFHHLRHSCLNWLLLRLCLSLLDVPMKKNYHFLDHPMFAAERCDWLRQSLMGCHYLGRQAIYVVAQMAGHHSPDVTFLSYIHLCDWLLAVKLSSPECEPEVTAKTVQMLSGITQYQVYALNKRLKFKSWRLSPFIAKMKQPFASVSVSLRPLISMPVPEPEVSLLHPTVLPPWKTMLIVLDKVTKTPEKLASIAKVHGVEEAQVKSWIETTEAISGMTTKTLAFRHLCNRSFNKYGKTSVLSGTRPDIQDAQMLTDIFEKVRQTVDRLSLIDGITYFLTRYSRSANRIPCHDLATAVNFVSIIKSLGIKPSAIEVWWTPSDSKGSPDNYSREDIARELGLGLEAVLEHKVNRINNQADELISIRIIKPVSTNIRKRKEAKVRRVRIMNKGFFIAMYLLAIELFTGDEIRQLDVKAIPGVRRVKKS